MNERWLPIRTPGFESVYEISDHGCLKSLPRILTRGDAQWDTQERIIKQGSHPYGYCVVCLKHFGNRKMERVHRLVAEAFIPNPNNFRYVNHIDNDPKNNHYSNLEWCTQKHNMQHAVAYERIGKINWDIVREIREHGMHKRGDGVFLARKYGISKTNVSYILKNRIWKEDIVDIYSIPPM